MNFYEIPLSPNAQRFFITLGGAQYQMQLVYRAHELGGWFLDVATAAGVPLVSGVPLVTGVDLLEPYPDLKFGGPLYVVTEGDPAAVPTFENLGTQARLYYGAPT